MTPQTLRELIMVLEAENDGATNKAATVGQLLRIAKMIDRKLFNPLTPEKE